jgi:hypothetical protein
VVGTMVLSFLYEKNGHTYQKKVRSYKQMDEEMDKLRKKGYNIVGGNVYK